MKRIEKILFYTLIFLLPSNLGYHSVQTWSYVNGLLVDYLIPTLYLQDIFIFLLICIWLYKTFFSAQKAYNPGWSLRWLFLFLFSVFLSVFVSINFYASVYAWLRLILYATFSLYIFYSFNFKEEWKNVIKVLSVSFFMVFLLGLGQWFKQGAVFNNYIFFGEQPYDTSTSGIAREHLLGFKFIPVYGTFRHPNVYAGVTAIFLFWLFHYIKNAKIKKSGYFYKAVFTLGLLNLLLTFSYVAIFAFAFSLIFYYVIQKFGKLGYKALFGFLLFVALFSFLLPLFSQSVFLQYPSFYRRAFLYETSLQYLKDGYIFGTGPNTNTEYNFENLTYFGEMRILQPVHNIFILLLVESGIFALVFFVIFIFSVFRTLFYKKDAFSVLFSLSLFQLVFLGLFDHYLFTIHQSNLILWLTVGFYFAYNELLL